MTLIYPSKNQKWQDAISPTGVSKPAGQSPSEEQPDELRHYDTNGVLLGSGFHCDSAEHGSDRAGELQCAPLPLCPRCP